ncbi:PEP/pyruvate-binding domain-containing protein [Breznakiella homolactica]|uniref:PEP/pyruvate-binding domain-containing protein n=1 Tax=Breznakiella homolactica TaxID=2798577 RepID=A0A7T8BC24_9SPIR|nr:PEP/pyruvate-binding domain-containing protein [Breznakiella homolactica]QQO10986.1 PEP/pyruvate-binding domain-containing protein [Breznakiella homolactica]
MEPFTTGLRGLDKIVNGIFPGDNLVFDVDDVDHYKHFARAFAEAAPGKNRNIIYFRFADHPPLLDTPEYGDPAEDGTGEYTAKTVVLDPKRGFEYFVSDLAKIVEQEAASSWFIFDCLSGLAIDWYSDRMMANFFLVVCPFILRRKSLAYFALYKHSHSSHATDSIYDTAQIIIEVWKHKGTYYIQPQKVENRQSPTMYMLHAREAEQFIPVTNSAQTADVVAAVNRPLLNFTIQRFGPWTASYHEATAIIAALEQGEPKEEEAKMLLERLLNMVITRQKSFLPLARRYFDLPYLLDILKRLIGSGLIGGKARGILLAQRILRERDPSWDQILEVHDSFFIGSDVFYTYVIQNDCWWLRRKTGTIEEMLERAAQARDRILNGEFLDYIVDQFQEMLEYFGQAPIIVRSSSIQEDSYGNAFSGKYESVFCANQGTPEERLESFLNAVRRVYASSMDEDALLYRLHHGLLYEDEQMALLVQRVSGDYWQDWFFPAAGGVGFSYNPFAWDTSIDPRAGMLRLAFGLGTRAVDRIDDDYTRIVALNQPLKRPDKHDSDDYKYIQRKVDLIDIENNTFATVPVREALAKLPPLDRDLFATLDSEAARRARELGIDESAALRLDFKNLFQHTDFASRMQNMLSVLEAAYQHPVDIEFTVNMDGKSVTPSYRINLVQCRPFQVKIMGPGDIGRLPSSIPEEKVFIRSDGPIVGRSVAAPVDRLIYVIPEAYTSLSEQERYGVARLVGELSHRPTAKKDPVVMVVGPGRWGTSTPAMGVPVSFNDIKGVSVMVELAMMHKGLIPDLSLGTHFFNDLVEMDMLYVAVFPDRSGNCVSETFLNSASGALKRVPPENDLWKRTVIVLEEENPGGEELRLYADATAQTALCYLT